MLGTPYLERAMEEKCDHLPCRVISCFSSLFFFYIYFLFCIYIQSHCLAYNVSISICEYFSLVPLIKISSTDNTTLPHPVNALPPYPFSKCPSLGPTPPLIPHLTFMPISCVCTTISLSVSVIDI